MKKNKIAIFALSVLLAFSATGFTGCADKTANVRVWSTYNTHKVMQSFGEYEDLGAKLDVLMVKGETEGAQLLITPDRDLKSARLIASDLSDGQGNVFAKENVKVYMQKYIDVSSKTPNQSNFDYPPGYTPDLLLPMQAAIDSNETSVVAGNNQGFTVEFVTTADTVAGTYTGTFTLNCDGAETPIPVTLEVRDIDVTENRAKTCIGMLKTYNIGGEYNNTSVYKNYYETAMNEYKLNLGMLPGASDPELFVESVQGYWDNPNFTCYAIPYECYWTSSADTTTLMQVGEMYSYIYALAKASTPDKILLSKAFVYPVSLDEPPPERYNMVRDVTKLFYETEDKVYADLVSEGFFEGKGEQFRQDMYEAITHIPFIQTATREQMNGVFGADCNTYCSHIDKFNTAVAREEYAANKEANKDRGGETWYYTCMTPIYPYPSHHLDDYLIGSRIMGWMQKSYNLDGYLYWMFNLYYNDVSGMMNDLREIDPYTQSQRYIGTQGDGFMFYPGKKYGIDTFLPSVRLTTLRDGMEDYNTLCVLEDLIQAKENYYGLSTGTATLDPYVGDLYASLFDGTVYNSNDKTFYEAKRALMDTIEQHRSGSKYLLINEISGNNAVSSVYLADGYTLTVNGETPTVTKPAGQGTCYTVTQSLDNEVKLDIVISKDGIEVERYNVFVSVATKSVAIGENGAKFAVNKGSQIVYGDGTAAITLMPQEGASMLFRPYVRLIGKDIVSDALSTIDTLYVTLTNNGQQEITLHTRLYSGYAYEMSSYTIASGDSVTVCVNGLGQSASSFADVNSVYFEVYADNEGNGTVFTVSDLKYSLRREDR